MNFVVEIAGKERSKRKWRETKRQKYWERECMQAERYSNREKSMD
jgi:hypothetical protein